MKRTATDHQLVEYHAKAKDIGSPIDTMPFSASLLGAHVGGSSCKLWPRADILLVQRQSEID